MEIKDYSLSELDSGLAELEKLINSGLPNPLLEIYQSWINVFCDEIAKRKDIQTILDSVCTE